MFTVKRQRTGKGQDKAGDLFEVHVRQFDQNHRLLNTTAVVTVIGGTRKSAQQLADMLNQAYNAFHNGCTIRQPGPHLTSVCITGEHVLCQNDKCQCSCHANPNCTEENKTIGELCSFDSKEIEYLDGLLDELQESLMDEHDDDVPEDNSDRVMLDSIRRKLRP